MPYKVYHLLKSIGGWKYKEKGKKKLSIINIRLSAIKSSQWVWPFLAMFASIETHSLTSYITMYIHYTRLFYWLQISTLFFS